MTIKNSIGDKLLCLESNLNSNQHQLIKKNQIDCLEKLNDRELYNMQLIIKVKKYISRTYIKKYFEKNFQNPELKWKDIYPLP